MAKRKLKGSETARLLAARIAAKLFTSGSGERASRVVLFREKAAGDKSMDLGGWCEGSAVDCIAEVLDDAGIK